MNQNFFTDVTKIRILKLNIELNKMRNGKINLEIKNKERCVR